MLGPWITSHFPTHRVYTEAFGGGASVLLRKARSYAEVYNDLDGELVNLFRVMRDQGDELQRLIELTPFARDEFDLSYTVVDDPVEQARRTLVRSHMGFNASVVGNTGFRSDTTRPYSTPSHNWSKLPEQMMAITERLRGVVLDNRAGIDVIRAHDAVDTLHYVDPPYLSSERSRWGGYKHEMTEDDHVALADALHEIEGMVVLSGYDSPLYDDQYAGWRKIKRQSHADGARARVEVLWLSPSAEAQQPQISIAI